MGDQSETDLRIQALNLAIAVMRDRFAHAATTGTSADVVEEASTYLAFLRGDTSPTD